MARPNKIVIVVAGDPPESIRAQRGDYVRIMKEAIGEAWGGPYESVDARSDAGFTLDPDAALVITGSSASVTQREPWMLRTEAELRRLHARGAPLLGVCFGHQLLAQALGGEVTRNPTGREMSTVQIERLADDPLFDGLAGGFTANACHSDTVARIPDQTRVLARSQGDPHQCLRFGPRCYGVQFHPEFDGALMRDYVVARRQPILDEGLDLEALHRRAADTPDAVRVLRNFVLRVASS